MSDKIFLSCRVSSKHNKAEMKGESNSVGNWEINQICINEQMRGVYLHTTIIINLNASYINLWQTILSLSCLAGTEVFKHYWSQEKKIPHGSGGIQTHAPEETGALNQRLRPLGHATNWFVKWLNWHRSLYASSRSLLTADKHARS